MFLAFAAPVARRGLTCRSPNAEAYVQTNVDRGLAILSNHRITDDARREQFRDFLTGLTDIKRIAMFTLGQCAAHGLARRCRCVRRCVPRLRGRGL